MCRSWWPPLSAAPPEPILSQQPRGCPPLSPSTYSRLTQLESWFVGEEALDTERREEERSQVGRQSWPKESKSPSPKETAKKLEKEFQWLLVILGELGLRISLTNGIQLFQSH